MASSVRERTAVRRRVGLFPSIAPSLNSTLDERSPEDAALCPEIDCLREHFPDDLLAEAAQRALAIGVGAERVLITAGAIDEEEYLRTLAEALGLTFDSLDGVPRAQCPIDDQRLIEAGAAGMLPLTVAGELHLVVAPRGTAVRRIIALVEEKPELAHRVRFTTSERLTAFVFRHSAGAIAANAADALKSAWPVLSAASPRWRFNMLAAVIVALFALTALIIAPAVTVLVAEISLTVVFLAWLALRLAGIVIERRSADPPLAWRDDELPVYTVISALYHEAASVDGLLTAIERFDYPGIMAQTPQEVNPRRPYIPAHGRDTHSHNAAPQAQRDCRLHPAL
jgi:hypothetical protein